MAVVEWDEAGVHYAALTEFEWNLDEPNPDHVNWAAAYARNHIGRLGGNVHFVGTADRSHAPSAPGYNQGLSTRRATNVYLAVRGALHTSVVANFHVHGVGDTLAAGPQDRWPSDRAVVVAHVYGVLPSRPPIPAWMQCIAAPCASNVFYVRLVGALSVGASLPGTHFGFSAVLMNLLVSDGQWALNFSVKLAEWSGGGGLGPPVSVNVTSPGPWNIARLTGRPIQVSGFRHCIVEMASAGVGGGVIVSRTKLRTRNPSLEISPFEGGNTFGTQWLELGGAAHAIGGVESRSDRVVRSGPSPRALQDFARGATIIDEELLPFR
jgi:hypothetical protein